MSEDPNLIGLDPDFEARYEALLADCAAGGTIMRPNFGARHPVIQGKLWRQSRDKVRIDHEIAILRMSAANYLADCIAQAGPSSGPWATNAIPGYSFHQWGTAEDSVWVRDGLVTWDTAMDGDRNGYQVYMRKAAVHGLTAIGLSMHVDYGHVQLDPHGSPAAHYNLKQIDAAMRAKWENVPWHS